MDFVEVVDSEDVPVIEAVPLTAVLAVGIVVDAEEVAGT